REMVTPSARWYHTAADAAAPEATITDPTGRMPLSAALVIVDIGRAYTSSPHWLGCPWLGQHHPKRSRPRSLRFRGDEEVVEPELRGHVRRRRECDPHLRRPRHLQGWR